jgi:hypothetical protein
MRAIFSGVLPQSFGGIKLGRVGRKLVDFQPVALGFEPVPDFRLLVIGGVVLNENGPPAAVMRNKETEEVQIGASIEDGGLRIMEAGLPNFHGAQDLDAFAFPSDGNFRGMTDSAPGGMQGGVLPETGFIGENQRPVLAAGFFLRRG